MLLVYTHKITPRLRYVFKQICTRILGVKVDFTSTVEDFIAHKSIKMSYTKQPLSGEVFVRSHGLLFEQGIADIDISVQDWKDTVGFFSTGDKSHLPYDIFAASFYLLSRYEEYLPHVSDNYGRFKASESLAFAHGFLQQPIIDIWAYMFKAILVERFPDFEFSNRLFNVKPIIDVPLAYSYKNKGLLRTIGGTFRDALQLKFKAIYERYAVIFGVHKDPYDAFEWIIKKQKQSSTKFKVFFLIGGYSTYDKNISITNKKFVSLIKSVSDYCDVGLKVSYLAQDNLKLLKGEKAALEQIINVDLQASRNSFSKLNLPKTYRNLVELEVQQDYSMGYTNILGFRAGTCTPFLFYDLEYEVQTPLQIHPYHCLDHALLVHQSFLDKKEYVLRFIEQIKKVSGTFYPIFHNYALGSSEEWAGFRDLFSVILDAKNE